MAKDDLEKISSEELFHRISTGTISTSDAFDSIMRLYQPHVFKVIANQQKKGGIQLPRDAQEDLTQEVFMRLWRDIVSGDFNIKNHDDQSMLTSLGIRARNETIDHMRSLRSSKRAPAHGVKNTDDSEALAVPIHTPSALSTIIKKQTFDALPERAQAVAMGSYEGKNLDENAESLGVSRITVARELQMLRRKLTREDPELSKDPPRRR